MKKITILLSVLILGISVIFPVARADAAFNQNMIMSDASFNNTASISAAQIDAILNARGSCISPNSGFLARDPIGYSPSGGYQYGSNVTAGRVIYDAAVAYDLNPQVLLVTLQKEQSLVTSTSCSTNTISKAVGYACPDGGSSYSYSGLNLYTRNGVTYTSVSGICVNSAAKAGFTQQLIRAAWLLKFSQQRSLGNMDWAIIRGNWNNSDDLESCYGGAMTAGYRKRCPSDTAVYYDGYTTIDSTSTYMGSGATASLYRYTPHFHGNQNFYNIFVSWFGDPNTACQGTANVSGATNGSKIISYKYQANSLTNVALTSQNNTGSYCAENHVLSSNYQSWTTHIATGMRASNPANGTLISMSPSKTARDNLAYVTYSGAGGAVEFHKFSPDLQKFPGYYDVATNLKGVTASNGMFVSGDFFGRGTDQLVYIKYSGAGGKAEVHMFSPNFRQAIGYYDVATNLGGVSATSGTFVAGDFLGRGYDQLAYVLYQNGSGKAEVHLFDQSLTKAIGFYDVPTNLGGVSASTGTFVTGNFIGRSYNQLAYVRYRNANNKAEVHLFNQPLTSANGTYDVQTILTGFDPAN